MDGVDEHDEGDGEENKMQKLCLRFADKQIERCVFISLLHIIVCGRDLIGRPYIDGIDLSLHIFVSSFIHWPR